MNKLKKNALHLVNIIVNYTPLIFLNFKKHYELYKILRFYRSNKLIKFRTYRIYLFTYVSKKLSIKQKLFILTHHYTFLKQSFKKDSLEKIFSDGVTCWQDYHDNNSFEILLKARHYLEFEGSLTLLFKVNGHRIFNLNFNFAPGDVFGCKEDKTILFISGLKGIENEFSNISTVSKAFYELSPRVILMKVLETLALSLGVNTIIAINVTNQVSYSKRQPAERFYANYDQFWEKLKGKKGVKGYYFFKCPMEEKPVHLIRYKKKRALNRKDTLSEIGAKTEACFSAYLGHPVERGKVGIRSLQMM